MCGVSLIDRKRSEDQSASAGKFWYDVLSGKEPFSVTCSY